MEQTDTDLQVLVLSTKDVRMVAAGMRIFADVIYKGVDDMIRAGRTVTAVSEMAAHAEYVSRLADRMDEEAKD